MHRTKQCPECGAGFSYPIGRGNDRDYCQDRECLNKRKAANRAQRMTRYSKCSTSDCGRVGHRNPKTDPRCERCFYRLRRTGSTDVRQAVGRYVTGAGYIKLLLPNHPLADSGGHAFEHRVVAHERYGPGIQSCQWCACTLEWKAAVVDHLDENKQHNEWSNLVVSCNNCNRARGAMVPFLRKLSGQGRDLIVHIIKNKLHGMA